ncbi:hypothetical protein AAVH_39547 [Aphelenchoides avenae]|nr:hypothetical protein AAVH_39547 [Aphelenchus avenae]
MVSLLTAAALLAYYRFRQRKRRFGIHPILRKRKAMGHFHGLFKDLQGDPQRFHRFVRMDETRFNKLLGLVKHREPLSPAERLLITLRFLATGNSFYSLASAFYVGHCTVANVVAETCKVLGEELMPIYARFPTTADEWRSIARGFWERWDLPHTLGAIDGKHVQLRAPPQSGTQFHNYKGTFSTVLLAMCDHRYSIIYANWHNYGSSSDAGIFDRSDLKRLLKDPANPLNLPALDPLPLDAGGHTAAEDVPYFFVGDGAFPLMKNLMVPVGSRRLSRENRIYNYRHSRARRMIESTFGLLCARWRILLRPIDTSAVISLHNFLVDELGEPFSAAFAQAEETQECSLPQARLQHANAHRARREAEEVRAKLIEFVNGVGAVEWQEASALVGPTQATAESDDDEDASQGGFADAETQDDDVTSDASEEF